MFARCCVTWNAVVRAIAIVFTTGATIDPDIASAQVLYSVGAANSPSGIEIAQVTAASAFTDGRLVLLDAKEHKLYLISKDGKKFKATGRKGGGPGELMGPKKLTIDATGSVIVFDSQLRRFSWFRVQGDSLVFARSVNVLESVQDFCTMADRLYTTSSRGRPVLAYRIAPTSLVLSDSMGASNLRHPLSTHAMVREFAQAGPIGCGDAGRQIAWHSSQLDAGQLLTIGGPSADLRLPNFSEVVMTPIERGIQNSFPKSGVIELVEEIIPSAGANYFVVTGQQRYKTTGPTYKARAVNSAGMSSLPTDVTARLRSFTNDVAVCELDDELPQVTVVRAAPVADRYPCDNTPLRKPQ